MKIASWNVNSIKARLHHVKDWLENEKPDVLLIQELKGVDFPADEFEALGYKSHAVGQKAYNGVAILSTREFKVINESLPGNEDDEQARYIEVDMNGTRIIGIYAPNGNPVDSEKFPYKLRWLKHLKTHINHLKNKEIPTLIGGDFNIIPENEDCYDPKAWEGDALFRPESRKLWRSMINAGYSDAFRINSNEAGQYSFWDYQAGAWQKDHGIRIDHFLLSPEITDRLKTCVIDRTPRGKEKASDHTPVILEIHD